jgi:hypothetical protein
MFTLAFLHVLLSLILTENLTPVGMLPTHPIPSCRADWLCCNASHLHSWYTRFESWQCYWLFWLMSRDFSWSFHVNFVIINWCNYMERSPLEVDSRSVYTKNGTNFMKSVASLELPTGTSHPISIRTSLTISSSVILGVPSCLPFRFPGPNFGYTCHLFHAWYVLFTSRKLKDSSDYIICKYPDYSRC